MFIEIISVSLTCLDPLIPWSSVKRHKLYPPSSAQKQAGSGPGCPRDEGTCCWSYPPPWLSKTKLFSGFMNKIYFQIYILISQLKVSSSRSKESHLSSVRKRLMWFVELSCVMKVSMFSRKTCGRRWTLKPDQSETQR